MLKGLFKGDGKRLSHNRQRDSKNEIATITPKLIIRAVYDYKPRNSDELGFSKEDFLYVVDLDDPEWYVACNPLTNSSGLVPISYFEVIQRPEHIPTRPITEALHDQIMGSGHTRNESGLSDSRTSRGTSLGSSKNAFSHHSTFSPGRGIPEAPAGIHGTGPEIIGAPPQSNQDFNFAMPNSRTSAAIYGVVLYDFIAERADELEAQAGESIVIIAQSNEEWFVAKPIGRLGGPGLIPVAYVQLREVGTDEVVQDVSNAIRRAGVPQVEEWKRRAAEYKASSISLGRFEQGAQATSAAAAARGSAQYATSDYQIRHMSSDGHSRVTSSAIVDMGRDAATLPRSSMPTSYVQSADYQSGIYVVRAGVERFAMTGGRYWYLVVAEMSNGMFRNLCRYYQDFYDFQIKLLEEFPEESGRTGGTRTLPFMPGPLTVVTHSISSRRRANLDEYVRNLIRMPPHISRSPLVQQLFGLREGDLESDTRTSQMPHPPNTSGDNTEMVVDAVPDTTFDNDTFVQSAGAPEAPLTSSVSPTTPAPRPQSTGAAPAAGHIKIKVFHGDELVAIRIPANLPFEKVYQKIEERIGFERPQLHARRDFTDPAISTDGDFQRALQGKDKIVMFAHAEDSTF